MASPFSFVVEDVFRLSGRGTAVVGKHPDQGEFRSGEVVEVVRGGKVLFASTAVADMPEVRRLDQARRVALVFPSLEADIERGDEVRAR